MMKYVVCGTSVEDVEAGIKAMKMAIANGATCGVGGSTMAEAEKGLEAMKQMVKGNVPTAPKTCPCPCSVVADGDVWLRSSEDEDEDEEIEVEESGYVAKARGYESDLYETPEEAMGEAFSEGYSLREIEIFKADLYEDGELVLDVQVYPL